LINSEEISKVFSSQIAAHNLREKFSTYIANEPSLNSLIEIFELESGPLINLWNDLEAAWFAQIEVLFK